MPRGVRARGYRWLAVRPLDAVGLHVPPVGGQAYAARAREAWAALG